MKYIKTKDGIFRKYKNSKIIDNIFYYPDDGPFPEYRREPILKQADTIKELCDCLVFISLDNDEMPFISYDTNHLGNINKFKIIFGAIWTDKGLIFVAKMKGVLPNGEIDWELL